MRKLTAPQVRNYIRYLDHSQPWTMTLDTESYRLLDLILERVRAVAPTAENGAREFWLKVDRGPIEDFADYEEWLRDGIVENREEFEREWLDYYPDKDCWMLFGAVYAESVGYKAIALGHRIIVEYDPREEPGFEHDAHELMEWLLEAVDEVIARIRAGTYNADVAEHLPPQHRTGTISQKALWDAFPESRDEFFQSISEADVAEFIRLMDRYPKGETDRPPRASFTASEFYRCCALGYKACGYSVDELTPKEMYEKFADGRDEGLGEIDADSPEAYLQWHEEGRMRCGHPWEVCRGGNSTHVSLYVGHSAGGYKLRVDGSSYGRSVEAIHFFLALWRAGYPVSIYDGNILSARLQGRERVGIVPEGIMPRYRQRDFPNEQIISFINLPHEKRADLLPHCVWQPIPKIELAFGGNGNAGGK